MDNGFVLAATIIVAAFAIDRVAAATFFLLSFNNRWNRKFPDPRSLSDEQGKSAIERKLKLAYYVFVGVLALIIVGAWHIRILSQLNLPATPDLIDYLFTAIVVMGGSGQIAELLRAPHTGKLPASSSDPLKITGTITLDDAISQLPRKRE